MNPRKLVYFIFAVFCAYMLFTYVPLGLRAFFYDSFRIPTQSMQPTLNPGDKIYVNKLIFGPRLYRDLDSAISRKPEMYRLPGLRKIKHNDIIVFNLPVPYRWDRIDYLINHVYCKRVIGLPADSIAAIDGFYKNSNTNDILGYIPAQEELSKIYMDDWGEAKYTFPFDSAFNWTLKNFGPLYIPETGATILIDTMAVKLYRLPIEYETQKKLTAINDSVLLGDSVITQYTFTKNYYFAAGDNVLDSSDSRYWGLLPEEHIVGIVSRIRSKKRSDGGS